MEFPFLLYLAAVCDNVRSGISLFTAIFCAVMIASMVAAVFSAANVMDKTYGDEEHTNVLLFNRLARKLAIVTFLSWVGLILLSGIVPTRKDVYLMAGGYVALKAAHNEAVQSAASGVLASIDKWLDKELKQDTPAKPTQETK